jgi:hypothetical protein
MSTNDKLKNETANGTKPVLADSAVSNALSTLFQLGQVW